MTDPAGIQPVRDDGRLQCLECGRFYLLLAPHLARAHNMTSDEYREAHRLPRTLALRAADLSERAREQGRTRYANRPDIQAALAAGRRTYQDNNATEASRITARYTMVVAARRRGGAGKREASRRRMAACAAALGFADIDAYFAAREGVPVTEMARELGVARTTVTNWRRGRSST